PEGLADRSYDVAAVGDQMAVKRQGEVFPRPRVGHRGDHYIVFPRKIFRAAVGVDGRLLHGQPQDAPIGKVHCLLSSYAKTAAPPPEGTGTAVCLFLTGFPWRPEPFSGSGRSGRGSWWAWARR